MRAKGNQQLTVAEHEHGCDCLAAKQQVVKETQSHKE